MEEYLFSERDHNAIISYRKLIEQILYLFQGCQVISFHTVAERD